MRSNCSMALLFCFYFSFRNPFFIIGRYWLSFEWLVIEGRHWWHLLQFCCRWCLSEVWASSLNSLYYFHQSHLAVPHRTNNPKLNWSSHCPTQPGPYNYTFPSFLSPDASYSRSYSAHLFPSMLCNPFLISDFFWFVIILWLLFLNLEYNDPSFSAPIQQYVVTVLFETIKII